MLSTKLSTILDIMLISIDFFLKDVNKRFIYVDKSETPCGKEFLAWILLEKIFMLTKKIIDDIIISVGCESDKQ